MHSPKRTISVDPFLSNVSHEPNSSRCMPPAAALLLRQVAQFKNALSELDSDRDRLQVWYGIDNGDSFPFTVLFSPLVASTALSLFDTGVPSEV